MSADEAVRLGWATAGALSIAALGVLVAWLEARDAGRDRKDGRSGGSDRGEGEG